MGFLSCSPVETTLCSWLTGMECPCPPSARAVTSTVDSYFSCGDTVYLPKVLLHCRFGQTPTAHLRPFYGQIPSWESGTWRPCGRLVPLRAQSPPCPHALSTQTRQGSGVLGASSEQGHLVLGQHKWLEMFFLERCPLVTEQAGSSSPSHLQHHTDHSRLGYSSPLASSTVLPRLVAPWMGKVSRDRLRCRRSPRLLNDHGRRGRWLALGLPQYRYFTSPPSAQLCL